MTPERAIEILKAAGADVVDGSISMLGDPFAHYFRGNRAGALLTGRFTADQLEALAVAMRRIDS